jgi:hypothetical protein
MCISSPFAFRNPGHVEAHSRLKHSRVHLTLLPTYSFPERVSNHPRWLLDEEKMQWKAQACHLGGK